MNEDELKEHISSIQLEEIDRFFQRIWDSDPGVHGAYEIPENIDPKEHSLADIIEFEEKAVMNLAKKVSFYYIAGYGWEKARFCKCGAENYYECKCEPKKRKRRLDYVRRKKEELFGINSKLNTLMALKWKLSDIDQVETLSDNILQAENEFPMLRKKIAQITGKAVQNFED